MVTHGEDSLNEHTEDDGLEVDSAARSSMDHLRTMLGRLGRGKEPSKEQLIATGEMDPEELGEDESAGGAGEEEVEEEEPVEVPPLSLTVPTEKQLSIRKQIEQRLMAGATRDELVAEGFNKKSIQTIASELKSRMHTHTAIGKAPYTTSKGMPVFAKGAPPEGIIDAIEVPDVADGQGISFEQGIKFGMSLLVLATRMMQELSAIGVTQMKPLLDAAKSMREDSALASKDFATEAAMEAASMIQQSLMPVLTNIQRTGGGEGGDPVKGMMVRTMEPIMQKLMGSMLGRLTPGTTPKQITEGPGKVEGWSRRSE